MAVDVFTTKQAEEYGQRPQVVEAPTIHVHGHAVGQESLVVGTFLEAALLAMWRITLGRQTR